MKKSISLALILISFFTVFSQKTHSTTGSTELKNIDKEMVQFVVKARAKLNKFKKSYKKAEEKKSDTRHYAMIRLYAPNGAYDQVYMKITSWDGHRLLGVLTNEPVNATNFKKNQKFEFKEEDILDWLIQYPNGKEKGNFCGPYLKKKIKGA